jgi:hypothetical protein
MKYKMFLFDFNRFFLKCWKSKYYSSFKFAIWNELIAIFNRFYFVWFIAIKNRWKEDFRLRCAKSEITGYYFSLSLKFQPSETA